MNFKPLIVEWDDANTIDPIILRQQLTSSAMLIVNNCKFTDKTEFLTWLGKLGPTQEFPYTKTHFEGVSTVNNSDSVNPVIFPQAGREWNNMPAGDWHLDVVFTDKSPEFTCLYGKVIPPNLGGTWFSDSHYALSKLSPKYIDFLRTLEVVHYRQPKSRYTQKGWEREYFKGDIESLGLKELQNLKSWLSTAFQNSTKPLIQVDSLGREYIYISPSKCVQFAGYTEEESQPIIDFLGRHLSTPEFVYQHQWQQDQLVIWSNGRFNHYGVFDYRGFDRILWRSYLGYLTT